MHKDRNRKKNKQDKVAYAKGKSTNKIHFFI